MNIVSDFQDNNIFHVLQQEILPLSSLQISDFEKSRFFIIADKIDKNLNQQKWRKFVLSNIFSDIEYVSKRAVRKINDPLHIKKEFAFDPHKFIDYPPRPKFIQLINYIKDRIGACANQSKYVLLCQRERDNRFLFDSGSELPLQLFLSEALHQIGIPFRYCDLAELDPVDQVAICSGASIFVSAHGAGATNIIFTPDHCLVMEFNFRKHWFCDPVCDAHFSGALANDEKCNGELKFRPYFHKADYYNLSRLLERAYVELNVDRYEGHRSRNPVSRKRLFVDGDSLIAQIRENFDG